MMVVVAVVAGALVAEPVVAAVTWGRIACSTLSVTSGAGSSGGRGSTSTSTRRSTSSSCSSSHSGSGSSRAHRRDDQSDCSDVVLAGWYNTRSRNYTKLLCGNDCMCYDADVYSGVNWTGVERAGKGGEQFGNCWGSRMEDTNTIRY